MIDVDIPILTPAPTIVATTSTLAAPIINDITIDNSTNKMESKAVIEKAGNYLSGTIALV